MKITYLQIQDHSFSRALAKLATFGGFTNYKALANIKSILKQFEQLSKKAQDEWLEILKQYSVMDEKGNFVSRKHPETGLPIPGTFTTIPEKEEEFKKKTDEFNAMAVEIKAETIPFDEVAHVGFSATDLIHLETVITPPAEADAPLKIVS